MRRNGSGERRMVRKVKREKAEGGERERRAKQ